MKYSVQNPKRVIREIQTYLLAIHHGLKTVPPVTKDGIYSAQVRDAVSTFQGVYHLPVTGMVDFQTFQTLYQVYQDLNTSNQEYELIPQSVFDMKTGDFGQFVIKLQSLLGDLSLVYPNVIRPAITGQYGLGTLDAVRAIQRNYGLEETGEVSPTLWGQMVRDQKAIEKHKT